MNVVALTPANGRKKVRSKQDLSANRIGLLQLMQRINFGRIENLLIRNGDPDLDPPPRVIREVKFPGENGPRPEVGAGEFLLKSQVVELFKELDLLGDGTIAVLEVKHGLPFRMMVEEAGA
jgi:hypothetical protein